MVLEKNEECFQDTYIIKVKIQLDLNELIKLDLSPSEYCALIIIEKDSLIHYPIGNAILTSLKTKGWLNNDNKIIKDYKPKEMIDQWIDLWPSKLLPGGYRVSGNYSDCKERMSKFIKKYGFSWDIIMEATKNYLLRQESCGWRMTKKNVKFIYDLQGSMLADECEAVLRGEGAQDKNNSVFL